MLQASVTKSVKMFNIDTFIEVQKSKGNANIELTYRCPLQCSQCFRAFLTDPNETKRQYIKKKIAESYDIPLTEFKKLCNFFNSSISLCGQFSDPVYHKEFFEILKICSLEYSSKKFKIHTAGHQKNIDWYREAFTLTGKNIQWRFGLDGLPDTSHIYRKNQNSQLIYDAMMLGKEMGVDISWQFIVFNYNEHQIDLARSICKKNAIQFHLIYTDRTNGDKSILSKNYKAAGPIKEYKN